MKIKITESQLNLINELLISEKSRADLFHGVSTEYAMKMLKENSIEGYTTQRYWPDGKVRKDDEPDYFNCYLMKGISTTRSLEFAKRWGQVIFVLNQDAVKSKYKIVPFNWGHRIGGGFQQTSIKKEMEEFVVTGVFKKILPNEEQTEIFLKPMGKISPLDKYLVGFYISKKTENFLDEKELSFLQTHPKFLGVV